MAVAVSRNESVNSILQNRQKEDYAWFLEHYSELYSEHGNVFLVIKNKKVIGKYSSYAEAVIETKKHEKLGSFIVQECADSEGCYTARVASVGLNII